MEKGGFDFASSIRRFNEMYDLPRSDRPQLLPVERLEQFKKILSEEVGEIDDILAKYKTYIAQPGGITREQELELLTDLTDWLGDIMVYARSEALRFGLPLEKGLDIIMQSNFSKLGEDGKPIYDTRHKVLKGPNYWKPEPKISEMLRRELGE